MSQTKLSPRIFLAVLAAGIMSFCGVTVETAMNIAFPTLMRQFSINTSTVQWMTTIYLLVISIVVPLSAYLNRSFTTRTLFLTANLFFLLGLSIDAFSPSFTYLLVGRAIQGIGTGIALPLMFNIIFEQVPPQKIGVMVGFAMLIVAVAPALGPTFGGIVVSTLGWHYIFILNLPLVIISLGLGIFSIKPSHKPTKEKFDIISFLAIIALFAGLILGINNLAQHPLLSVYVSFSLIIGLCGLGVLIYRSNQLENPLIDLTLFTNYRFTGHIAAYFSSQLMLLGLAFLLPNYVQLVNGSSATIAGLLVLPGAVLGAILAPLSGRLLDKAGARKPILLGAILFIISMILYVVYALNLSNFLVAFFYIIFMCGSGVSFGNIMTSGQQGLSRKQQTDANALFNTLQQFAGAIGVTLVSLIVELSQSNSSVSYAKATAIGSRNGFIVLLILAIIQLVILFFAVKPVDK